MQITDPNLGRSFMDWNRRKMWPAAAASLVAFTSLLNAADDTQLRNLENRVNALEQRKGSNGMVNPPARPVVKDGVDLFFQGDALLWQANQSGLGYAIKNAGSTNFVSGGTIENPKGEWSWGFKLALGYNMQHDNWDTILQWTCFGNTNSHHRVQAPTGGTVFPSFANNGLVVNDVITPVPLVVASGATTASAHWSLQLNILDLALGREFYVSKWLTLRPHAGLRTAWVRQKLNCVYDHIQLGLATGRQLTVHMHNNYWGMGLRAGLDGNWGLGAGFSIFNELAASLLLGHFSVHQKEYDTATLPNQLRLHLHNHLYAARAIVDMALGLRYENTFSEDRYGIMLAIAWEQHLFFSQNQLARFYTNSWVNAQGLSVGNGAGAFSIDQGDLNTQGVTFTVRFDF